jgi:signal transduction histidine kinase
VAALDQSRSDLLLAVALTLEAEVEARLVRGGGTGLSPLAALALIGVFMPVAVRRRWPGPALVISCSALALGSSQITSASVTELPLLAPVLLSYGVGAWRESPWSLAWLGAGIGLLVILLSSSTSGGLAFSLFTATALNLLPWGVGALARERGRRAHAFNQLAAQAVVERAERERTAASLERARIGGELGDIIAHSLSAMVVHASGARRGLRSSPDQARESILVVEQTGRETLAEVRRLLGLLRRQEDPTSLLPQPGLDRIPELVETFRGVDFDCSFAIDGAPIDLTPGINLVAYRVIEAALGHLAGSPGDQTGVVVKYRARAIELEVAGNRAMAQLGESLRPVAERVALYGGSLDLAANAQGGWTVQCRLPLQSESAA